MIADTREIEGFTITLDVLDEEDSPDDSFDFQNDDERKQLYNDIESGNLLWFCARVTASKCDIPLASTYLGGCCYHSLTEFLEDGYYSDMITETIREAKQKIKEIIK